MGTGTSELVKLHLGCGSHIWEGFINIDKANNSFGVKPDVDCDIRRLPFPDECVDEIHAIHVIEHFYVWETPDILLEWRRVLRPKCYLYLELPDLTKVMNMFVKGDVGFSKTWCALYGDPNWRNPDMLHKWAYTFKMLKNILNHVGYDQVEEKAPIYHFPNRDMRIVARKGKELPCFKDGRMSLKICADGDIC